MSTERTRLLDRLGADGGQYLLTIAMTKEERDAAEQPEYTAKAFNRFLTTGEYRAIFSGLHFLENDSVHQPIAIGTKLDNVASMCRRLGYALKRSGENDKLVHQCVELLKRYGLGGSVIREMDSSEGSTSREGGQNPVVTPTKSPV